MTEIQHLTALHYVSYAEKHHGKQKYFFIQDRNKNTQPLHQGNFILTFSQHLVGIIVIQIKARAYYNMQCHFVSVILFAHSLTSVTSLNPSLQHPCLPVSLVYLSVVPSFTSFPDCLPYPHLPSSPPPLFCVCYSVFPGRGTHIHRDMCSPRWGNTYHQAYVFPRWETNFTRDMCFPGKEMHISRNTCSPRYGNIYHYGYVFPRVGEHISLRICVSHVGNTYH